VPESVKWFRKAAEQGDVDAQYNLGMSCHSTPGILQDYVQAYMWLELAAGKGKQQAALERDALAERMTQDQIREAQSRAWHWQPKKISESHSVNSQKEGARTPSRHAK